MNDINESKTCVLNDKRRGGCGTCDSHCAHRIALNGYNGKGGRVASAMIPNKYRHLTLANSPVRTERPKVYEFLDKYAERFNEGTIDKNLYLWSREPGTGKTTTSVALLNEHITRSYLRHIKNGETVPQNLGMLFDINEFQTAYNLATMTRDNDKLDELGTQLQRVSHSPFVVIDDIGIRDATEAFKSYVHSVINYRLTNGLPTVYTSNLPIDEMADVFDARLYDRIRDNCGVLHFDGKSKRGRV